MNNTTLKNSETISAARKLRYRFWLQQHWNWQSADNSRHKLLASSISNDWTAKCYMILCENARLPLSLIDLFSAFEANLSSLQVHVCLILSKISNLWCWWDSTGFCSIYPFNLFNTNWLRTNSQLSALAQERRTGTKISPVFLDTGSFGRRSFQFFIEFCFLFSATESDTVHHIFDCLKWLFRIDSAFCELLSLCLFRIFFWTQLRSSSWRWQLLNCENNCHGWGRRGRSNT